MYYDSITTFAIKYASTPTLRQYKKYVEVKWCLPDCLNHILIYLRKNIPLKK